jgi:hypothetical protein
MKFDKETPGTYRFADTDEDSVCPTIYIKKSAFKHGSKAPAEIGPVVITVKKLIAVFCLLLPLTGCATRAPGKLVYRQDQFQSRLEYLRFCQHYELLTYRCPD